MQLQLVQLRVATLIAGKTKEGRELQEVSILKLLHHAGHIGVAQLLHQRARWAPPIQLVMVTCMIGWQLLSHGLQGRALHHSASCMHACSSMASCHSSKQARQPQHI